MHTAAPGQTTILTQSGIPSGSDVGFQVLKAATGSVAITRTTAGVIERPSGSGNFVINFVAPVEGDLYLVVVDWASGVIDAGTSRVLDLSVTTEVQPGSSGLGAVADYVKMYLGGETWKGLTTSSNFGPPDIVQAIEVVKCRVIKVPPPTNGETLLHPLLLDYLGLCAAIQLIPAARDYWGSQLIAITQGDDPTEVATYPNRAKLMDDLLDELMAKVAAAMAAALPYIDDPVLRTSADGPAIDEDDDCKVTDDPRDFPQAKNFPFHRGALDAFGYPIRSGVSL